MLEQVLLYIHNWFVRQTTSGVFTIDGGTINTPSGFVQDGQYFRIKGSVFNDGLHQWPPSDLTDETFEGYVQALAIPKQVIDLATEIEEWQEKYGDIVSGPYQSESFANYSYSKGSYSGADGSSDGPSWQSVFKSRMNPWRKIG